MRVVSCPVDGCDYSGPLDSVCGHYGGKRDSDHSGGPESCREILTDGEKTETDSDTQPRDAKSTVSNADGQGENPLFEGPEAAPTVTTGGEMSDPDEPADEGDNNKSCCDSPEVVDVAPGRRFRAADGRTGSTEPGDEVCQSCGALHTASGEVIE